MANNQVGLFFKELNNNEYVKSIVNSDDNTEENLEVKANNFLSKLLESEELMIKLKTFVDDDKFIKDKIETFIKQILKKKQKPVEKVKNKSCNCDPCNCDPCNCDPCECNSNDMNPLSKETLNSSIPLEFTENDYRDNIYLGKYNKEEDIKNDKIKWITKDIRLEHINHLIKMTTCNFEVFY